MIVFIVGSGAREHALAWRLRNDNLLYIAEGNVGTADFAIPLNGRPDDVSRVVELARALRVGLAVIGPEDPLSLGVVDRLETAGIRAFGPTQAASQIEASKSFALEVMDEAGVPHPRSWVFDSLRGAEHFLQTRYPGPVAVKGDGLAGGKAVYLCYNREDAMIAIKRLMQDRVFKEAGDTVVIQDLLEGVEVSVFAFSDGNPEHILPSALAAACDYKRLYDGDQGPNTGGMGSYAWPEFWTDELAEMVANTIMRPVIRQMALRGAPFKGVLYAGVMLTRNGPRVLEFNCRLGDPEAQVILPLLKTNPIELMLACREDRLNELEVRWRRNRACVGVVVAIAPYPCSSGDISDVEVAVPEPHRNQLLFHGATRRLHFDGGKIVASTLHRAFTAVGMGVSVKKARDQAYALASRIYPVGHERVMRSDIAQEGSRVLPS